MFRITTKPGLLKIAIGATALVAAGLASAGASNAHDGRYGYGYEYGYERPAHGWRPAPPAFHGFWGARHWRRYHEGYGVRPPPPPPGRYERYGWR